MKYKNLTSEQARKYCLKNHCKCENCELRRENNKKRTLLCFWIIQDLLNDEENQKLREEEIKYYKELEKND